MLPVVPVVLAVEGLLVLAHVRVPPVVLAQHRRVTAAVLLAAMVDRDVALLAVAAVRLRLAV
jgi:hypothetical protein